MDLQATYRFTKLEGCGNSIVVLDASAIPAKVNWPKVSRSLLDHSRGIGADGLMIAKPLAKGKFEIFGFNPDGSDQGMCGNGLRCIARYLFITDQISGGNEVEFVVGERRVKCLVNNSGDEFTLDMGRPVFEPNAIPLRSDHPVIDGPLVVDGERFHFSAISMGNPHCVIFVPNLKAIDLERLGPRIENLDLFPARTNVEFVELVGSDRVKVLVWERGAGATLACGSGACATVVAAVKTGRLAPKSECTVELPGGELRVRWDERVSLIGPAVEICRGEVSHRFFQ